MSRLASFGRFFPYLRPYRLRMAAAALLVMGAAGINLSMLWVIRRLVDTVLVQRDPAALNTRSEEHTSELQSRLHLVCRLLLEKKNRHDPYVISLHYLVT